MSTTVIHTLEARDNFLLEVMRDYFQLDNLSMQSEIRATLAQTISILHSKGVSYPSLKSALVPATDRREAAFIFDTTRIRSGWYGLPIHTRVLALLSKEGNHSILVGDCLGSNERQDMIFRILSEAITLVRTVDYRHSTQFYTVYINNLSDAMLSSLHEGLTPYPAYTGFADLTFASPFKLYLSTVLVNHCVINRRVVIVGHEDDVPNEEDINTPGYPFEEKGFILRSLQSSLFDLFLSYKIERPVLKGLETDTEFALASISPEPKPLAQFTVRVDQAKFEYLLTQKAGSMKRSGLLTVDRSSLEEIIREKVSSNYIYNMRYDEDHEVSMFDILLEFQPVDSSPGALPVRVMAAFEYIPRDLELRLVTLY